MKLEELKIKIGIILRSASLFFASCMLYIVLRGLIEGIVNGDVEPTESFSNWKLGKFIIKWFLISGGIVVTTTLFYTLIFGIKHRANFKIVVPAVLVFIILFEIIFR